MTGPTPQPSKPDWVVPSMITGRVIGGSGIDEVHGITVDAAGNAYLTGETFSTDFPGVTAASAQSGNAGGRDAFVVKLSPTGSAFVYSTYLGGSDVESGNGIAVDPSGNAYVTGIAGPNFPTVKAIAPNAPIGAIRIMILMIPKNTIITLSKPRTIE